jgi:Flp pilus assembly CpaF family ATPase
MSVACADAHGALVETLDTRVRQQLRRDGVDPQAEVALVRRIAEEAVRAHDERSLTGQVSPVPDPQTMVGELVARVAGFGPLQPYLDDPSVEEIWINHPTQVFIARNGRHELTTTVLTRVQVTELVERMLKASGRRVDLSQPSVDAMLQLLAPTRTRSLPCRATKRSCIAVLQAPHLTHRNPEKFRKATEQPSRSRSGRRSGRRFRKVGSLGHQAF